MATYQQDTDELIPYSQNWTTALGSTETITSFTVTPSDTSLTITNTSQSAGVVTYWVSGGASGDRYTVKVRVVTSLGRELDDTDSFFIGPHQP